MSVDEQVAAEAAALEQAKRNSLTPGAGLRPEMTRQEGSNSNDYKSPEGFTQDHRVQQI